MPAVINEISSFGFKFAERNHRIDWRKLASLDPDKVIRTMDIVALQENISNITFCDIQLETDMERIDPNYIKLFRVAQLVIEYLMFCQETLEQALLTCQGNLQDKLNELETTQDDLACAKREAHKRKNLLVKQQEFFIKDEATRARKVNPSKKYPQCPHCPKKFFSPQFLNSHISRKHSNQAQSSEGVPNSRVSKLEKELKVLTEKLTNAENRLKTQKRQLSEASKKEERLKGGLKKELDEYKRCQESATRKQTEALQNMFMTELKELQSQYTDTVKQMNELKRGKVVSYVGDLVDADETVPVRHPTALQSEAGQQLRQADAPPESPSQSHLDLERRLEKLESEQSKRRDLILGRVADALESLNSRGLPAALSNQHYVEREVPVPVLKSPRYMGVDVSRTDALSDGAGSRAGMIVEEQFRQADDTSVNMDEIKDVVRDKINETLTRHREMLPVKKFSDESKLTEEEVSVQRRLQQQHRSRLQAKYPNFHQIRRSLENEIDNEVEKRTRDGDTTIRFSDEKSHKLRYMGTKSTTPKSSATLQMNPGTGISITDSFKQRLPSFLRKNQNPKRNLNFNQSQQTGRTDVEMKIDLPGRKSVEESLEFETYRSSEVGGENPPLEDVESDEEYETSKEESPVPTPRKKAGLIKSATAGPGLAALTIETEPSQTRASVSATASPVSTLKTNQNTSNNNTPATTATSKLRSLFRIRSKSVPRDLPNEGLTSAPNLKASSTPKERFNFFRKKHSSPGLREMSNSFGQLMLATASAGRSPAALSQPSVASMRSPSLQKRYDEAKRGSQIIITDPSQAKATASLEEEDSSQSFSSDTNSPATLRRLGSKVNVNNDPYEPVALSPKIPKDDPKPPVRVTPGYATVNLAVKKSSTDNENEPVNNIPARLTVVEPSSSEESSDDDEDRARGDENDIDASSLSESETHVEEAQAMESERFLNPDLPDGLEYVSGRSADTPDIPQLLDEILSDNEDQDFDAQKPPPRKSKPTYVPYEAAPDKRNSKDNRSKQVLNDPSGAMSDWDDSFTDAEDL